MLARGCDYAATYAGFRWQVPELFNIAVACCDRWAEDPARTALLFKTRDGEVQRFSFADMRYLSNRLAHSLRRRGVSRGDRVGILLSQSPETAFAHLALYKLGAVAVPLFSLFGVDAIEHRAADCRMKGLITDHQGFAKISEVRKRLPELELIYLVDGSETGCIDLHADLAAQLDHFDAERTGADDPAMIIYTSGTTGKPKGALHAHRVLLGHLPCVQMSHDFFPQSDDMLWTPADWAWIGGLLDVLLPAWYFGVPVVACRFEKFDGESAFALLEELPIRNVFLPPTALKLMRTVDNPQGRWQYRLRSVASGGESLGSELLEWGRSVFGLTINEFYGQTECNLVLSSCASLDVHRAGAIGKAVPGHEVNIVDDDGNPLPDGKAGNIAVAAPNPVMFLGYWDRPDATSEKYAGRWLLTGDQGVRDNDGYVRFVGRDDDVITSSGYRIGPGPIEDCLLGHPAVRISAVVGKPDAQRTEIVKAFVVLAEGYTQSPELVRELQDHVRRRLAAHEYPREVEFVESLPMTATGKIVRRVLRDQT